jgi:hypothetical protein
MVIMSGEFFAADMQAGDNTACQVFAKLHTDVASSKTIQCKSRTAAGYLKQHLAGIRSNAHQTVKLHELRTALQEAPGLQLAAWEVDVLMCCVPAPLDAGLHAELEEVTQTTQLVLADIWTIVRGVQEGELGPARRRGPLSNVLLAAMLQVRCGSAN